MHLILAWVLTVCSVTGDVVGILVGENEKRFTVHETPPRAHSAFFKAALGRDWKESVERVVNLPEEHEEHFPLSVEQVYRGLHFGERGQPQLSLA